ncbi:MAG: hypothetical protein HY060_22885 [Proteobacteria bacterium]|nr:hypothetical protein [Pseudomonadota bacterium]
MSRRIKTLVLAVALLGGPLLAGAPALAAEVTVGVGPGGIAFGYADGYWDRERNWHAWRDREEHDRWREANREHYHGWKHDRDHDHGWHEHDRYWDRR